MAVAGEPSRCPRDCRTKCDNQGLILTVLCPNPSLSCSPSTSRGPLSLAEPARPEKHRVGRRGPPPASPRCRQGPHGRLPAPGSEGPLTEVPSQARWPRQKSRKEPVRAERATGGRSPSRRALLPCMSCVVNTQLALCPWVCRAFGDDKMRDLRTDGREVSDGFGSRSAQARGLRGTVLCRVEKMPPSPVLGFSPVHDSNVVV